MALIVIEQHFCFHVDCLAFDDHMSLALDAVETVYGGAVYDLPYTLIAIFYIVNVPSYVVLEWSVVVWVARSINHSEILAHDEHVQTVHV